jgi:hypothetical protein
MEVRSKEKINELETQNDWAKDITGNPQHISDADSGLKGYYCMGCDKEMQAVKFKNPAFQSYFRHHAHNVNKGDVECVFSSRVYRERLAEQILRRLKELKVPAVYKYPPKGVKGNPILLAEKTTIKAASVKAQLSFYEDENGEIKWGSNPEIDDRYLLIRPDVTFFDKDEKPILFVEFVITHKLPDDKKVKLKRLGINTVQIIIPKVPEEEIEKSLKSVTKVKWVYNDIESNTNYIPVSEGDTEGILSIDEEQRKLFEESYSCRAAQFKDLIRSIDRSVESESYKRVKYQFEREISRIKETTTRNRERLGELERGFESEVYADIEPEAIESGERYSNFEQQQIAFEEYYSNLETRYTNKATLLKNQDDRLKRAIREYIDNETTGEGIRNDFEGRKEKLQNDSKRFRDEIEGVAKEQERFGDFIRQLEREEQEQFEQFKNSECNNFERCKRELEQQTENVESKINNFREFSKEEGRRVESDLENIRNETIERISQSVTSGNTELSKRIKSVSEIRGFLSSYDDRKNTYERYRSYLELFRNGAWKKW